jgi:hypothetical protein
MKTENNRQYYCDEGKVFRRKADGFIMGNGLDLGATDSIENYEEVDDPNAKDNKEEEKTNE